MAKNKNKGFTLIEVMIAIAILTLLLVPIMKQFTQTLDTSRRAKELQYANEAAAYLLEYSQRNDLGKLASGSDATDEADELKLTAPSVKQTVIFQPYDTSGSGVAGLIYPYHAYKYEINDVKLGARNTVYHRSVILDDLSVVLGGTPNNTNGKAYRVAYDMTEADLANFPSGFELTNEGSIVRYNSDGYVVAAACREIDVVSNPNDTNLGNMQDLDATKVAIISGTASNFDSQADALFFSKTMEKLKQEDPESYKQAMLHESNDSVLNTIDYLNATNKLTKLYIDFDDCGTSDKTDDYYIIKADVYYINNYSFTVNSGNQTVSATDVITYNVFSQKFFTDKCPDVYFEYQPYTVDYAYNSTVSKVTYASNDYIMLDTFVDDAKIYLYKPTNDQSNVAYGKTDNGNAYYVTEESSEKVKLNIFKANADVKDVDIFTNLEVDNHQFYSGNAQSVIPTVTTDSTVHTSTTRADYNLANVQPLAEDKRTDNRLMTVTVKLTPDSKSVSELTLTGAKGEN